MSHFDTLVKILMNHPHHNEVIKELQRVGWSWGWVKTLNDEYLIIWGFCELTFNKNGFLHSITFEEQQ